MRKMIYILSILFLVANIGYAKETKKIKKSISTNAEQKIYMNMISGMDVDIKVWDKDEVFLDLTLEIKASDEEYEKKYIDEFMIEEDNSLSRLTIDMEETDDELSWSFWNIFKLKFNTSISRKMTGTIMIPRKNDIEFDVRYSQINCKDVEGELIFDGRGNDFYIENCKKLNQISNRYGDMNIRNCAGSLDLESRSNVIEINNYEGDVKINSDYSDLDIVKVTGSLDIYSRSGKMEVKEIGNNLFISSDYSEVLAYDIKGNAKFKNRSGSIKVKNALGLSVDAPYSTVVAENIESADQDIKIVCRSGGISLTKITSKQLNIEDAYSSIDLKNVKSDISISSRSSTINATRVEGNWNSNTNYETINILNSSLDNIDISNRSGNIELDLITLPKNIFTNNDYGSVVLTMPYGFNGKTNLKAKYGKVRSDISQEKSKSNSSETAYREGTDKNSSIRIETRSGDIEIFEEKK